MTQSFTAQRVESRLGAKVTALLVGRHGKLGVEKAITENVSARGVRVISETEWYLDDMILISVPAAHFTAAARVAYCTPLGDGRFGTGLEFAGEKDRLELNVLSAAEAQPA